MEADPKILEEFDRMSKEASGKYEYLKFCMEKNFFHIFLFVEIYLGSRVAEIFSIPSALDFLRNYVSKNLPVIIRSSELSETKAVKCWNSNYLRYILIRYISLK